MVWSKPIIDSIKKNQISILEMFIPRWEHYFQELTWLIKEWSTRWPRDLILNVDGQLTYGLAQEMIPEPEAFTTRIKVRGTDEDCSVTLYSGWGYLSEGIETWNGGYETC